MSKSNSLNPNLNKLQKKASFKAVEYYVQGIREGNRIVLSQAITIIESQHTAHQALAQEIIEACLPHSKTAKRIAITGAPGVGKSTFIETIGLHAIQAGSKLAVLAIDPSSQISGGSILGDKTRMQSLSSHAKAFVRPSSAGETLGGVAKATRASIILCEAAGYDTILIETVGVGQSEIAVHAMVDCFVLLLMPGGGDELQGIKRGIVEMADIVCINKADSHQKVQAETAQKDFRNALHLFPPKLNNWTPQVLLCAGLTGLGIPAVWATINQFFEVVYQNGWLEKNRKDQARHWLKEHLEYRLKAWFYQHPEVQRAFGTLEQQVIAGKISSFHAAEQLLKKALKDAV